jgi:hypothetical protein
LFRDPLPSPYALPSLNIGEAVLVKDEHCLVFAIVENEFVPFGSKLECPRSGPGRFVVDLRVPTSSEQSPEVLVSGG